MSRQPRVFIASSGKNLSWANAVQANLSYSSLTTVWNQGVFSMMETPFDSLLAHLDDSDFGVFICMPEDMTRKKGKPGRTVRDNVIFELGLYIGRLGKDRSFILVPDDEPPTFLPTDLFGITPGKLNRSAGPTQAATGPACSMIQAAIGNLGRKVSDHVLANSLGQTAIAIDELRKLLVSELSGTNDHTARFVNAIQIAHNFAQTLVEREWPCEEIVVSLKVPCDDSDDELECIYLTDRLPLNRLMPNSTQPVAERIPIDGSIAGWAFKESKSVHIEDVEQEMKNKSKNAVISKSMARKLDGVVGSVIAHPITIDGVSVAVVKIDSPKSGFFGTRDLRTEAVARAIVSCFNLAYRIGFEASIRSSVSSLGEDVG